MDLVDRLRAFTVRRQRLGRAASDALAALGEVVAVYSSHPTAHLPLAWFAAGEAGATAGDSRPLVLRGGRAVASWSHRFAGDRMAVRVTPFPGEAGAWCARLPEAFVGAGAALGADAVEVEVAGGS